MSSKPPRPAAEPAPFTPVATRRRHDGWTARRQVEFIEALAASGCVDEACKRVGMSASSAYALRARFDASSFRQAWDHALDYAIRRLSDAAFSRAINGVARPVFYKGEQVGERVHHDERLTMFLLSRRDPVRYGAWIDQREARRHPEGAALTLAKSLIRVDAEAFDAEMGRPPRPAPPIVSVRHVTEEQLADEAEAADDAARTRAAEAQQEREWQAYLDACQAGADPDAAGGGCGGDVA